MKPRPYDLHADAPRPSGQREGREHNASICVVAAGNREVDASGRGANEPCRGLHDATDSDPDQSFAAQIESFSLETV